MPGPSRGASARLAELGRPSFDPLRVEAKKGQSRRSLGTDGSARERDPIKLLENNMRNYKLMSDEKMEAIDAEEEDRAQKIYEEADKAPFPDPSEVYDDVYKRHGARGRTLRAARTP